MVPSNFVLSDIQKGLLAFFLGLVLLLHTLGVFTTGLSFILIILSLALMLYGFTKAGLYKKTVDFIQKHKSKRS